MRRRNRRVALSPARAASYKCAHVRHACEKTADKPTPKATDSRPAPAKPAAPASAASIADQLHLESELWTSACARDRPRLCPGSAAPGAHGLSGGALRRGS